MVAQQGRLLNPVSGEPSPLLFVTAGGSRVEIVRGDAGSKLEGDGTLSFSGDGGLTYSPAAQTIGSSGMVFVRYTPGAISSDALRTIAFSVDGVPYHCEALELKGGLSEAKHATEILRKIPEIYRLDSTAINVLAVAIAWATYPLRMFLQRPEILVNPALAPGHMLQGIQDFQKLPELTGYPVQLRRKILALAEYFYQYGGSATFLSQFMTELTNTAVNAIGTGAYLIDLRVNSLPVNLADFKRLASYWLPAWVVTTFYFGYYTDGEIYTDGTYFTDGQRI
jgi:hypothetical protein